MKTDKELTEDYTGSYDNGLFLRIFSLIAKKESQGEGLTNIVVLTCHVDNFISFFYRNLFSITPKEGNINALLETVNSKLKQYEKRLVVIETEKGLSNKGNEEINRTIRYIVNKRLLTLPEQDINGIVILDQLTGIDPGVLNGIAERYECGVVIYTP